MVVGNVNSGAGVEHAITAVKYGLGQSGIL